MAKMNSCDEAYRNKKGLPLYRAIAERATMLDGEALPADVRIALRAELEAIDARRAAQDLGQPV